MFVPVTTTLLELALPAVPGSVREARDAVGRVVDEIDGGDRLVDDVRLCVSEAVTNSVRHAYTGIGRGEIDVHVDQENGSLIVVVRDDGVGIVPSRGPTGARGFGLKIIDRIASRSSVRSRRGAGTELRMVFMLPRQASRG
jgi:two-component sensor histidine kinase